MPHDEKQSKRGPDGKFLPGHKPPKSPGRPPGAKGIKARASKLASEQLERMLGRATDIISDELDAGNPAIAQWLIDRVRPPGRSDFVQLGDDHRLTTVPDIVGSSERIAIAAARGEISLHQAKSLQEILGRHIQLKGFEELAKLRAEVEALRQTSKTYATVDKSLLPKWGRLGGTD
ncbi:hypothetical protein [Tateyamaria sp. Alg231-49]|uniref:hypothetical protein n=1 Tax=Tateyamaria sp. Alg231-49 TaxID=1922219 RepID=UPI000D556439|nr:hypothetical protein [Tateyamaria sp. Alg231-49]